MVKAFLLRLQSPDLNISKFFDLVMALVLLRSKDACSIECQQVQRIELSLNKF